MSGTTLAKRELFSRLAAGHAAKITVVTPNRRLAQALAGEFDRAQVASARTVWQTADILPYGAFVERLYEDAAYSDPAAELPLLLTVEQEQSIWEEIVRDSEAGNALLAVPETAALAREAWELMHAWRLVDQFRSAALSDDAMAFSNWAQRYAERTKRERFTDHARLADVAASSLHHRSVKKPELLVAYGFDIVTPQQRALFDALAAHGVALALCGPTRQEARTMRIGCADAKDEIKQAAQWARAQLEANDKLRIGIVVPDLGRRKSALRRVLAQTMAPGGESGVLPFNISLGDALSGYPLVAHALIALELGGREIEFERASLLVRSPFIALGESERQRRARLDAMLRHKRAEPSVTLDRLAALVAAEPALAQKLDAYATFRDARLRARQSPADWAGAFNDALSLLGFPGERALDSTEYQTLKKWHELLARFARLERVAAKMRFDEALARLRRMAAETLFQPDTPDVPIQVLGVLEAAGMEFDRLWVMGLADEAWPMQPRPNPFIPVAMQRAAQLPNASPGAALDFATRLTAQWLAAASEVVLSYPKREQDRDLAVSPLIAHVPETTLHSPRYQTWRETLHRSGRLERFIDAMAPAHAVGTVWRGGVSLIRDQAACPFRAFAHYRLEAKALESPHGGLDARERGTLVHRVLAYVWGELRTKRALDTIVEAELEALVARVVDVAMTHMRRDRPTTFAGRFARIEKARLVRLALAWLAYERRRDDFNVIAVEERRSLTLGPLQLSVCLDRVDETAGGARIVIDYKTSKPTLASMLGARPDEPQLPLYVTAAEAGAAAAAFAQVRADAMRFVGLARDSSLLPNVTTPDERARAEPSWDEQVAFWRAEMERIATEFASGHAHVDPKRGGVTCRQCGAQSFCRIHERIATFVDEDE